MRRFAITTLSAAAALAWAHVDVAEDFGLGVALCPADCRQTPDGAVNVSNFLALLARWGEASVGGPCPPVPLRVVRPPAHSSDRAKFEALRASWGPCDGCEADLDGDGVVGVRDMLAVLAAWPPE